MEFRIFNPFQRMHHFQLISEFCIFGLNKYHKILQLFWMSERDVSSSSTRYGLKVGINSVKMNRRAPEPWSAKII